MVFKLSDDRGDVDWNGGNNKPINPWVLAVFIVIAIILLIIGLEVE